LSQGRVTGRYKSSTSSFSPNRSRLGSAGSQKGTAKRHRHRARFVGSRNRTTTGVERHRRTESHIQNYWTQWKSFAVRNGLLERNWVSANGRSKLAQIVVPRSKVENVLTEMHDGPSGRDLGVNETLNKILQQFYWLQTRNDVEIQCRQCDVCAARRCPRTSSRVQIHQYKVGALPAERTRKHISTDRYGLFHQVAGNLRSSQPGGLHSSSSSRYQLLLRLRHTSGVTQRPGP
jgi:hypothetical protein